MDRIILILLAFFIGICLYYLVNDRCRCVNEVIGYNEGFSVGIAKSKSEEEPKPKPLDICDSRIELYKDINGNRRVECDITGELTEDNASKVHYIRRCTTCSSRAAKAVHGDILSLKKLPNLQIIGLSDTDVSGNISSLSSLSKLENLVEIDLSGTNVSGNISSLKDLKHLEYIDLSDTNVSGDIKSLKDLKHLKKLYLFSTKVSGDINDFLTPSGGGTSKIESMLIHDTKITGDITDLAKIIHDFAKTDFFNLLGHYGIQNTNIYGDISKMAEMLIDSGYIDIGNSIEIVGLDETCVFYTGGDAEDIVDCPDCFWDGQPGAGWIYIGDGANYNVNQFPTVRGGDLGHGIKQGNDCWSCSMTQRVIEDSIKRTEDLKAFYSGQHKKDEDGNPNPNIMCPSLDNPVMCDPKKNQLCPDGIPCPPCGKVACECPLPPPINSNSNSENYPFN